MSLALCLALLAALPPDACAQDNPDHCAVAVAAGQAAPYAGQLLTPSLAASLGAKVEGCEARITEAGDNAFQEAMLKCDGILQALDGEIRVCEDERDALRAQILAPLEPTPVEDFFDAVLPIVTGILGFSTAYFVLSR